MGVSYIPVARIGELSPGAMKEVDLGGRHTVANGNEWLFGAHGTNRTDLLDHPTALSPAFGQSTYLLAEMEVHAAQ